MLSLPPSVRIFLCLEPTDMRRGFDGLACMAEEVFRESPFSGHLFVFCNRRRDRVKIIYWDVDGYALWYKRLEKGRFRFSCGAEASHEVKAEDLWAMLSGIDLQSVRRGRRYQRPVSA